MTLEGSSYQRRLDELAASGADLHGEAAFVCAYSPATVLDAGCGTGRVAIELARRGVEVVGVDANASMLAVARERAPAIVWVEEDLVRLDLGRRFDLVLMAGNVPLFTRKGTEHALVAGCARHVAATGRLLAGFTLRAGYGLEDYDRDCAAEGLVLVERYATWDRGPFADGGDYAVSVHARRGSRTGARSATGP